MTKSHRQRAIYPEPLESRLHFAVGSLDETFSFDGRLAADVSSRSNVTGGVAIQLDGKILLAGSTFNGNNTDITLVRFNQDGSTDRTFGPGGADGDGRIMKDLAGFDDTVTCMTLQRDGKILVAGQTTFQLKTQSFVARFNRDGTLDTNFDGDGFALPNFGVLGSIINDIAVQPDGNIVVVATVPTPQNASFTNVGVARLTTSGSPDFTFSGSGSGIFDLGSNYDRGNGIALQDDGKIVLTGIGDSEPGTSIWEVFVMRLDPDGTPDVDFDADGKNFDRNSFDNLDAGAYDVVVLPSGRIAVCGYSGKYGQIWFFRADGGFSSSSGNTFNGTTRLHSIAVTVDQTVVGVGTATYSSYSLPVVRQVQAPRSMPLQDDQISDPFSYGNASYQTGTELLIQQDGKVLIAGTHDTVEKGATRSDFGLARVMAFEDDRASISGRVFKDRDGDGVRDDNDSGHAAVRVYVDQDKNGKFDAGAEPSTLTDANGKYTLPGLPAGSYRVRRIIPKGYRSSYPTKSFFNTTLEAAENAGKKDFGNTIKALLSGRVFRDDDADGMLADNEQGMKNFTVFIDANNNGKLDEDETRVLTDETGRWSFVLDAADDVLVRVVKRSGFEATTRLRLRVDLNRGENSSGHVFGLRRVN